MFWHMKKVANRKLAKVLRASVASAQAAVDGFRACSSSSNSCVKGEEPSHTPVVPFPSGGCKDVLAVATRSERIGSEKEVKKTRTYNTVYDNTIYDVYDNNVYRKHNYVFGPEKEEYERWIDDGYPFGPYSNS